MCRAGLRGRCEFPDRRQARDREYCWRPSENFLGARERKDHQEARDHSMGLVDRRL